jgi:hypothetical protein
VAASVQILGDTVCVFSGDKQGEPPFPRRRVMPNSPLPGKGPVETPVDVYGPELVDTSARDLLTTDIGHAMVRMQRAVFAERDGATRVAVQPLRDLLEYLRLAVARAADPAGAGIVDHSASSCPWRR